MRNQNPLCPVCVVMTTTCKPAGPPTNENDPTETQNRDKNNPMR